MATGIVSYCFFCGAPGPAGTPCGTCLVTIPRPSPEVVASFACPRCTTPLTPIGIAPSATIHACGRCHGMFVGARAWCTIVQRPELAREIASKLPARDAPPSALVGLLRCPACAREMERGRFGASSNIVIDVCVAHGLWLDGGEVVAVANHAGFRARVGASTARRAVDAADSFDGAARRADADAEAESALRLAEASVRSRNVKRGGVLFLMVLAALRIGFFFANGGSKAPAEAARVGESANSAAGSLRSR